MNFIPIIVTVLWLRSSAIFTEAVVQCINCRKSSPHDLECHPDCRGDVCAVWSDAKQNSIQGCLSGLPPSVTRGCRENSKGAKLCLCHTELCNELELLNDVPTKLQSISCRSFINAPYVSQSTGESEDSCESNACFYHVNRVLNFAGQMETQISAGCSPIPEFTFDVQVATIWPGPGAVSGACYLLQAHGNDTTLGCMCDSADCNAHQPFELPDGTVECYQANNRITDSAAEEQTCMGQLCMVQKIVTQDDIRYMKGCLTVSQPGIVSAGYRNFLGVEQWICDKDLCNANIELAASVITPDPAIQDQNRSSAAPTVMTDDNSSTCRNIPAVSAVTCLLVSAALLVKTP